MKLQIVSAALALAVTAPALANDPAPIRQAEWVRHKKFVQLPNGIRMGYLDLGDPNGEPLLLLHGYTDSSRSWSLLVPYLTRYRLLIPDQRGHGATSAPDCCYGQSQFAYDAKLFLDALKVSRVGVAGHSMGSMVAITMAADYPDRVTRIALLGSTALTPAKRGDWLYDNVAALRGPLDPSSQFAKDWHPANQPTPVDREFATAVNSDLLRIPVHVWHGVMRELSYVPVGRHAADVKAPVFVLSGEKDPIFAAEHHASLLKAFPAARSHVYPKLGHNFLWEAPADVGQRLSAFFAGQ